MQKSSAITALQPQQLYTSHPYAYSHITRIALQNISEIIHISGQSGENVSGEVSTIFEEQIEQVFFNLQHALDACGLTWQNIAQMTILIVDHSETKHALLISQMQYYFTQQNFPACTLIPVPCLALKEMAIEIDAVAYRFQ